MTYDAKTPTEQVLAAAGEIARRTLEDVTMRDPQAPVSQLYFVAIDVGAPNGRVAAACLLVNQGKPPQVAQIEVAARAHEARMNGTVGMLGVMVKKDGALALLRAIGLPKEQLVELLANADAARGTGELLVVAISTDVHTTSIKGNAATDPIRWN